jgi:TBC1 domain family member 13
VAEFAAILKVIDPQVFANLEEQQVNHQFYSLRWLMLLMCQEFDMSNVISLWDTLFSDPDRFYFFNFVCVASVLTKRDICLEGDFADCMESL